MVKVRVQADSLLRPRDSKGKQRSAIQTERVNKLAPEFLFLFLCYLMDRNRHIVCLIGNCHHLAVHHVKMHMCRGVRLHDQANRPDECLRVRLRCEAQGHRHVVCHILRVLHTFHIDAHLGSTEGNRLLKADSSLLLFRFLSASLAFHPGGQNPVFNIQQTGSSKLRCGDVDTKPLVQLRRKTDDADACQPGLIQWHSKRKLSASGDFRDRRFQFFFQNVVRAAFIFRSLRAAFRLRQRLPVDLLVLVQGNRIDLHCHCRDHVGRFLSADKAVQPVDIHLSIRHHVGSDELFACRLVLKCLNGGVGYSRKLTDHLLDFRKLNTVSPHLHLAIAPTQEIICSIGKQTNPVAGAVNPVIVLFTAEGIGDEGLLRRLRAVQIASPDAPACHQQLSGNQGGQPTQPLVHHIQLVVAHSRSDGNPIVQFFHRHAGNINRCLRRSVMVAELRALLPWFHRHQLFSAHDKIPKRLHLRQAVELASHLGGKDSMGDLHPVKPFLQRRQIEPDVFLDDIQGGAAGERRVDVHQARVKAIGRIRRNPGVPVQPEFFTVHGAEICKVPMLQHHSLGHTGGSGGVKQDKQVLRCGMAAKLFTGRKHGDFLRQKHLPPVFRHPVQKRLVGDQQSAVRILHHEIQPFRRIVGVQRLIGRAGLQHTEGRNCHILAARNQDGNHIPLPDALAAKTACNPFGDFIRLPISIAPVPEDDCRPFRIAFHRLPKQGDHVRNGVGCLRFIPSVHLALRPDCRQRNPAQPLSF